ncbi:MAG: squalene/phytoene synthase family protein [Alphaproteobacteria bacterium]|nr:squalene/phytoene synthase family protein [Alphaproteobacteria bacterium]
MNELDSALADQDPDRYVANFFAPAAARPALTALYSFDNELRRVGLTVREPMAGHIRLAWWREQIAAIYDGRPVHAPVPLALAAVVARWQLPRALLEGCIDGRAHDLEETPFADEAAFEAYADATSGGLLLTAARALGADRIDDVAHHAGRAAAYGAALREFAAARRLRRYRLPLAWLNEAGLNAEDAFATETTTATLEAVFRRARARAAFALDRVNRSRFRLKAMPAIAVAVTARRTFDPLAPADDAPWRRVARLALANLMWRV